ncbi:DsbA family protein [Afifella sp. H1R]|uniref:Protein-disulfide isomerase n=1 Tax=Consotaella salsifontis TaxID=1365950 RepID=A0A1T4TCU3_9HYPH|nr:MULTISPECIES: DsbA family protein [Hyphomicrobiales]MCF1506004.1 DsbA family protein [Afifella sp. H1R]SKA38360.1 Protein-disulfide isomerase [Consotaella salsifontis]
MSKRTIGSAVSLALSVLAVGLSGAALLFATGTLDAERPVSADFASQARSYLLENPEVLVESFRLLEERQQAAETNELQVVIAERRDEIFHDPAAPVGGNPQGAVTLVEFFDYNCPYCRKAIPVLAEAEEANDELRVVYKEFPILGPGSEFAARAALASQKQGRYEPFHEAMMAYSGSIDESSTLEIAAQVGLDVEQLKQDMQDPQIEEAIGRNLALAQALRITGTPTFIVGDEIVRGLVDAATLQEIIADATTPGER